MTLAASASETGAGEFLLAFDADGRCRELREYWALTPARVDPPAGRVRDGVYRINPHAHVVISAARFVR
jgi:hypothetical protein